jgi:hypothetical protein
MDSNSAKVALDKQLHQAELQFKRKRAALAAIATALDRAVDTFDDPDQEDTRRECRDTVNAVLRFLSTHAFATTDGHVIAPYRLASTHHDSGSTEDSDHGAKLQAVRGGRSAPPPSTSTRNASWASVAASGGPPSPTKIPRGTIRRSPTPRTEADDLRVLVTLDTTDGFAAP